MAPGWGHVGVSSATNSASTTPNIAIQRPGQSPGPHHPPHLTADQDLLLANRRPPTVWVSTVLGRRSLSGLVPIIGPCYWHGRGTGRSPSPSTCGLFVPKPLRWSDPRSQSPVDVLIGSGRVPVNPSRCAAVVTQLVTHPPTDRRDPKPGPGSGNGWKGGSFCRPHTFLGCGWGRKRPC
jgi:hypothetical protein